MRFCSSLIAHSRPVRGGWTLPHILIGDRGSDYFCHVCLAFMINIMYDPPEAYRLAIIFAREVLLRRCGIVVLWINKTTYRTAIVDLGKSLVHKQISRVIVKFIHVTEQKGMSNNFFSDQDE